MTFVLVAPPLDGPVSGGTLFNRAIVQGLRRGGHAVEVVDTLDATQGFAWVDTLHLEAVEDRWTSRSLGLLAHYLPSLVEHPRALTSEMLRPAERAALLGARVCLCPSAWMAETLRRLGARGRLRVLEPPLPADVGLGAPPTGDVRLVLVGALGPGKGQLPLLEALADAPPTESWSLDIIGRTDLDPAYARACREAARDLPVDFIGPLDPRACLDHMRRAHGLVSASVMESYGMAIAEAQGCGVPVLALDRGNVGAMVQRPGSVGLSTIAELVAAIAAHVDNPGRRVDAARANPRVRDVQWDPSALLTPPA